MNFTNFFQNIEPKDWLSAIVVIMAAIIGVVGVAFFNKSSHGVANKNQGQINIGRDQVNIGRDQININTENHYEELKEFIEDGFKRIDNKIEAKEHFDSIKQNPTFIKLVEAVYDEKIDDLDYTMPSFWKKLDNYLDRNAELTKKYNELVKRGVEGSIESLLEKVYKAKNNFEEQKILDLVDQYEEEHTPEINCIADAYFIKAVTLENLMSYEEAEKYYLKAIALNDADPIYKNNYGLLLNTLDKHEQALKMYDEALDLLNPDDESNHHVAGVILSNMASVKIKIGDYEEAKELQTRSLSYTENIISEDDNRLSFFIGMSNLAYIHYLLGEYNTSKDINTSLLDMMKVVKKDKTKLYAVITDNLAQAYVKLNDFKKAEEIYSQNNKLFESFFNEESLDTAKFLGNISLVYKTQNKLDKADEYSLKALEMVTKILGKDNILYAMCLYNRADLLLKQKKYNRAKQAAEEGTKIFIKHSGKNHPEVPRMKNTIKVIKSYLSN